MVMGKTYARPQKLILDRTAQWKGFQTPVWLEYFSKHVSNTVYDFSAKNCSPHHKESGVNRRTKQDEQNKDTTFTEKHLQERPLAGR